MNQFSKCDKEFSYKKRLREEGFVKIFKSNFEVIRGCIKGSFRELLFGEDHFSTLRVGFEGEINKVRLYEKIKF